MQCSLPVVETRNCLWRWICLCASLGSLLQSQKVQYRTAMVTVIITWEPTMPLHSTQLCISCLDPSSLKVGTTLSPHQRKRLNFRVVQKLNWGQITRQQRIRKETHPLMSFLRHSNLCHSLNTVRNANMDSNKKSCSQQFLGVSPTCSIKHWMYLVFSTWSLCLFFFWTSQQLVESSTLHAVSG